MSKLALALASMALIGAPALADFAGQPLLGPLTPGVIVAGDVTGHADDNDGFDSGGHFFNIWDGGDDVWTIDWAGGSLRVDLLYNNNLCDVDLFVYSPGSLDSTGDYAIANTGHDIVQIDNAVAGTYYINVDSTFFSEGAYTLKAFLVPTPGSATLIGIGAIAAAWRRRR